MPDSINHISKKQLIEFINTNLYVDDMITIDRHLETCDKCKKHYEKLMGSSDSKYTLITQYKNLIISVLVIICLVVVGYSLKSKLFTIDSTNSSAPNHNSTMLMQDSLLADTLVSQSFSKDSVDVSSSTESQAVEGIDLPQNETQTPIETNHTPEPAQTELELNEINQNTSPTTENQTTSEPDMDQDIAESQAEKEEISSTLTFKVAPVKGKLAAPIIGYQSYNSYLSRSIDQLILPINGIEESSLILSFEIQEDKSLSNFIIKSSTNKIYAESMIEVIKNGPKWKSYISQEDSAITINLAEISIEMAN